MLRNVVVVLLLCSFTSGIVGCGGSDTKTEIPTNPLPVPPKDALQGGRTGGVADKNFKK